MNISICQYRAAIGLFNSVKFRYVCSNVSISIWVMMLVIAMVLIILLLSCSGDVHPNPGPITQAHRLLKLNICHANVRSLTRAKVKEIGLTLAKAFDIITLSETHLSNTVPNDIFSIQGFHDLVRKDRDGLGGGVAVYVKECLSFVRKSQYESNLVEAIWLDIKTLQGKLLICCCYRPPAKPGSPDPMLFWDSISSSLDSAFQDGYKNIILLGDFNADPNTNQGRMLSNLCYNFNMFTHINRPTRITTTSATILDQIISNIPNFVVLTDIQQPVLNSDHCVVSVKLNFNYIAEQAYQRRIWNYKITDFNLFRSSLEQTNFDECFDSNNIDDICQNWTNKFMKAALDNVHNNIVTIRPKDAPWYSSRLRYLKRKVNLAFKKFRQVRSNDRWNQYSTARNLYQSELSVAEYEYKKKIGSSLKDQRNSKQWWHKAKVLMGKGSNESIPSLYINNTSITNNKDKANAFNSFFLSHSKVNDTGHTLPNAAHSPINLSDITITENDVFDQLKCIDCSKSSGPDEVTPTLLKQAGYAIVPSLTKLFNCSLLEGKFPQLWKNANVTPLFKKGNKNDINNYRPVSLLSCVSKIFEKIVFKYMFNYMRDNQMLTEHQSGFRPKDSTVHQLAYMYHKFCEAIDKKKDVQIVLCDISKAFNKVWHKGLIYKLENIGINGNLLQWFTDYLSNRKQKVVIKGQESELGNILAGVPRAQS